MARTALVFAVIGLALTSMRVGAGGQATSTAGPPPGQASAQPRFRASSDLVRVDVVAVDGNGDPIRGLTRADFTVLDAKKPQTIAIFDEVTAAGHATGTPVLPAAFPKDVADNQSARASRLIVIVLDDMVIRPYLDQEKALARQVVDAFGDDALLAYIDTSDTAAIEPTDDRSRILRAIDNASTYVVQMQGMHTSQPNVAERSTHTGSGCHENRLEEAARMIGPEDVPRKAFVLISPFCGRLPDPGRPSDPDRKFWNRLMEIAESFRRANVVAYALDPRGAMPFGLDQFPSENTVGETWQGSSPKTRSFSPVLLSQQALSNFTAQTGGFALTDSDDFDGAVAHLQTDLGHYYTLAFYPEKDGSNRYHPIDVQVNRPGVTLRYRLGYFPAAAPIPTIEKDSLAGASAGVVPDAHLPLRLAATPIASNAKMTTTIVILDVRVPASAAVQGRLRDRLDATILAVSARTSKAVKQVKMSRSVDVAIGPQGADFSYAAATTLDLSPGTYQLRVSARSAAASAVGSVYLVVDLPDRTQAPVVLGGLVVGRAGALATPAATPADATLIGAVTLNRVFAPSDRLSIHCDAWHRNVVRPLNSVLELLDSTDRAVLSVDLPTGQPGTQMGAIDGSLDLNGLAAGPYRLRLTASDLTTTATRELSFVIAN